MTTLRQEMRKTLKLAWPIMTGLVGQMLFNLLNTLMMGRYSTTSLAASTFVTNLQMLPMVSILGAASCISVLSSQAMGRDEPHEVWRFFVVGRKILVWIASAAFVGSCALGPFLSIFGQAADVTAESQPFLQLMGLSLIPLAFFQAMRQLSESLEKTLTPALVNLIALLINGLLNYVLIYGHWGFPQLGLTGAGIGTLVARTAMACLLFSVVRKNEVYQVCRRQYLALNDLAITWKDYKKSLKIGVPNALQFVFEMGIFATSAILMGWMSKEASASHQITVNHAGITYMFTLGLANASTIRIARAKGRKDWTAIRRIGWSSVLLAMIIMGMFALAFIMTRDVIPPLFVKDPAVVQIASDLFLCLAFFQLFDAAQGVLVGALRGISDVVIPTLVTFVSYWLVGGLLVYFFGFRWGYGPVGVWAALGLALLVAASLLALRFQHVTRKNI